MLLEAGQLEAGQLSSGYMGFAGCFMFSFFMFLSRVGE